MTHDYHLFAWDEDSEKGGFGDYIASADSIDVLRNLAGDNYDFWEVVGLDDIKGMAPEFRNYRLILEQDGPFSMEPNDNFDDNQDYIRTMFEDEILPMILEQYDADDEPAINEGFNNWTDSLCQDGQISDHMYNNITRVTPLNQLLKFYYGDYEK